MNFNFILPEPASKALKILNCNGFEAYVCGGFVRDSLLSIPCNDCDITTSAKPDEILRIFSDFKTIETGLKHGTVTVIIDKTPLEITTFRSESVYTDGRHPDNVSFITSLDEDLIRRDFTINALAFNPQTSIIDKVSGISDLQNNILRAVGNPEKRFKEDSLRILRCLRFSSVYGFKIEKNTAFAALKYKNLLKNVSAERIFSEFKKILCGKYAEKILTEYKEIIFEIIPELKKCDGFDQRNPHHIYDVYLHSVKAVGFTPQTAVLRFSALLHDVGKPEVFTFKDGVGHFYGHSEVSVDITSEICARLKTDNKFKNEVLTLIKYHDPVISPNKKTVARWLRRLGKSTFLNLLDLKSADNLAQSPECACRLSDYQKIRELISEIEKENGCFTLKKLKINGNDLIDLGFPQGKIIGDTLNILLDDVISEKIPNEKSALSDVAKQLIK